MERVSRFRAHILLAIFVLIVGFFAIKLYNEQIIKTGGNTDNSITYITKTRVKAARGDLLDTNGICWSVTVPATTLPSTTMCCSTPTVPVSMFLI